MQRVRFSRDYDHRWASGAETAFKAGWEGPVKDEVATAAEEKGVLEPPKGEGGEGPEGLSNNVMQLRKIARDEEIDLGDAATAADIQAAIVAARKVKAETA